MIIKNKNHLETYALTLIMDKNNIMYINSFMPNNYEFMY